MDLTGLSMGGAGAAPAEEDALNAGFRLYHGSAAKFDQPSTKFINTGQGAQTYGWGLYGAQAEPVALDMRDQLTPDPRSSVHKAIQMAADIRDTGSPDPTYVARAVYGLFKSNPYLADSPELRELALRASQGYNPDGTTTTDGIDAFRKLDTALPRPKGHMQEWEVNADPNHFLDWDALHDEQSAHVMNALQSANFWPELESYLHGGYDNPTGKGIYKWLTDDMDPEEASKTLLDTGIPGIKVLDALSRRSLVHLNRNMDNPNLTRNFVIPDDSMIKVTRHYNAAGVPATLANMAQPGSTP